MYTIIVILLSLNIGLLAANFAWMVYSDRQLTRRSQDIEKKLKYLQEKYGCTKN